MAFSVSAAAFPLALLALLTASFPTVVILCGVLHQRTVGIAGVVVVATIVFVEALQKAIGRMGVRGNELRVFGLFRRRSRQQPNEHTKDTRRGPE